jgi:hypothetical protein
MENTSPRRQAQDAENTSMLHQETHSSDSEFDPNLESYERPQKRTKLTPQHNSLWQPDEDAASVQLPPRKLPSRKAALRAQGEKWSECVAAAHIVQDEVREYTQEHAEELDETMMKCFAEWTGKATKKLVKENTNVLNNIHALAEAQVAHVRLEMIRDDNVRLKRQIQRNEDEMVFLKKDANKQEKKNRRILAASRFLSALDRLRK